MRFRALSSVVLVTFVIAQACVDANSASFGDGGAAGSNAGGGAPLGGASAGAPPSVTPSAGSGQGGSVGVAGSLSAAGSTPVAGAGGQSGAAGTATGGQGGTAGSGGQGASGSGGKSTGGAGSANVMHPPPIMNGANAWASRYWDCCKPACGWQGNVRRGSPMKSCSKDNQSLGGNHDARNACESGGSAFMCWDGVPWSVSDKLSFAFAAASGPNYVCGRCFQLQFTGSGRHGNNAGVQSLNGKTMIVQVINNGGVESDQFDLLIPGGGVGALNACSNQWGTSELGAQYGGFLAGCTGDKNCVQQKCQQVFAGKPDLQAGCDWFLNWFNAADNPNLVYKQIACPPEITERSGLQDPG